MAYDQKHHGGESDAAYTYTADAQREYNPNAFTTPLVDAERRTAEVLMRLQSVTDALCGGLTETSVQGTSKAELRSVPSGQFAIASAHGRNISEMLDKFNDCLSRIERALP